MVWIKIKRHVNRSMTNLLKINNSINVRYWKYLVTLLGSMYVSFAKCIKDFLPPLMTIKVVSYAHASACCSLRALFLLLPLRIPYVYHTFASHDIFTYIWPVCHSKVTLLEYLIKRQLRLRFCFCFHLLCDYSNYITIWI